MRGSLLTHLANVRIRTVVFVSDTTCETRPLFFWSSGSPRHAVDTQRGEACPLSDDNFCITPEITSLLDDFRQWICVCFSPRRKPGRLVLGTMRFTSRTPRIWIYRIIQLKIASVFDISLLRIWHFLIYAK